jgi:hypothetical protein
VDPRVNGFRQETIWRRGERDRLRGQRLKGRQDFLQRFFQFEHEAQCSTGAQQSRMKPPNAEA